MKRYRGNQKVHSGVYFNPQEISFKSLDREGRLPGTDEEEYPRVPTLALLIAGPIPGGVYVIFLPLIGLAMLAWLAVGKIVELAGCGRSRGPGAETGLGARVGLPEPG